MAVLLPSAQMGSDTLSLGSKW